MAPDASTVGKGAAGTAGSAGVVGGVADALEGNGLDRASQAAGDTLRGIFGGLPWEMSAGEIVSAVTPDFIENLVAGGASNAPEAAGMLVDIGVVIA
jgi:hypothetical protein